MNGIEQWWLRVQFNREQQLLFLDVFFSLLKHGVGVTETLEMMSQSSNEGWAQAAKSTKETLRGVSVSDAMRDWFDPSIRMALKGPEETPKEYPRLGAQVVASFRQEKINHGAWLGQIMTPFVYVMLILGVYVFLSRSFYPVMAELLPITPGSISYWVNLIGLQVGTIWPYLLGGLLLVVVMGAYMLPRWVSPSRQTMDRYFPLSLYRVIQSAMAQQQISILMGSGSDLKTALSILKGNSNPHMGMYLSLMRAKMREGVSEANMLDVGLLHREDISYLELVSGSAGFVTAMEDLASKASLRASRSLSHAAAGLKTTLFAILCFLLLGAVGAISSLISEMSSMMYQ